MRYEICKVSYFCFFLTALFLFFPSNVFSQGKNEIENNSNNKLDSDADIPELADIIPLASRLSGRLSVLDSQLTIEVNIEEVEKNYAQIEKEIQKTAADLDLLIRSKYTASAKITELKQAFSNQQTALNKVIKPVREAISQFSLMRKDWQAYFSRIFIWGFYKIIMPDCFLYIVSSCCFCWIREFFA